MFATSRQFIRYEPDHQIQDAFARLRKKAPAAHLISFPDIAGTDSLDFRMASSQEHHDRTIVIAEYRQNSNSESPKIFLCEVGLTDRGALIIGPVLSSEETDAETLNYIQGRIEGHTPWVYNGICV